MRQDKQTAPISPDRRVLLTGATGYVGGRLLKALETRGFKVRCLRRRPESLEPRVAASTEVVAGDVLDPASLCRALEGVDTAYYLIHSMGAAEGFQETEASVADRISQLI